MWRGGGRRGLWVRRYRDSLHLTKELNGPGGKLKLPDIKIKGINLHYTDEGTVAQAGPETIVFSHGLLLDRSMFTQQIDHLKSRYRCIAYDHRGRKQ